MRCGYQIRRPSRAYDHTAEANTSDQPASNKKDISGNTSEHSELAVLGQCLKSKETAIYAANLLTSASFSSKERGQLFQTILDALAFATPQENGNISISYILEHGPFSSTQLADLMELGQLCYEPNVARILRRGATEQTKQALTDVWHMADQNKPVESILESLEAKTKSIKELLVTMEKDTLSSMTTDSNSLIDEDIPMPDSFLGEHIITRQSFTMLNGEPGTSKSMLALQLAVATTTNQPWLQIPTSYAKTAYLGYEMPRYYAQQRLITMNSKDHPLSDNLLIICRDQFITVPHIIRQKQDYIDLCKRHQLDLLIIDPLSRIHDMDENNNQEMGMVCDTLNEIIHETHTAIVLVHHTAKGIISKTYSGRGSSRFGSDPTTIMFVSHVEDSNTLQLEFPKTNYAPQQKPIFFDVTSSGLCTTTDAPQTPGELRKDKINDLKYSLREYLHEQFPVGRKLSEIMQAVPSEFSDTCYKNYLTSAGAEKQGRSYTLEPPNPTP